VASAKIDEAGSFEELTALLEQDSDVDLILLDLNLPRKGGLEVLAEIKEDPGLKHIPVVVLTTSRADQDVLRAYQLHANCYIAKPVDLDQFMSVIQAIKSFWLGVVMLPPRE